MTSLTRVVLILCFLAAAHATSLRHEATPSKRQALITRLYNMLQKEQQHEDVKFSYFPLTFERRKGLYHSYIKINLVDGGNSDFNNIARKVISIYDMNMFVSNFVVMAILDAVDLGTIQADASSVTEAIEAILRYKDKNSAEGIPIYTFWPQVQDSATSHWRASPDNMIHLVNLLPDIPPFLGGILEMLGLGLIAEAKSLLGAFKIPPDVDDSSINLALGEALRVNKNSFPDAFNQWQQVNKDYTAYFNLLKKYAYRPFLNSSSTGTPRTPQAEPSANADWIDPRTYYYLHPFLNTLYEESQRAGTKPTLVLPTTWILDRETESQLDPDVSMPFHTNNVDLTVNANFLYGTSYFLLTQTDRELVKEVFDDDLKQMYVDSAKMIAWAIRNRVHLERPDLCLVYYPSVHDFFWFAGRVLFLLDNAGVLPFEEMENVRQLLVDVLRNEATQQLEETSIKPGPNTGVYWEEFLGNYANKTRGADRLFSTSMALNALLDIWTRRVGSTRLWRDDVPESVLETVRLGEQYLSANIERWGASHENAFFSGSIKTFTTFPFFYPGNLAFYANGTRFDPHTAEFGRTEVNYYMQGYVQAETYEAMLNETYFGMPVPRVFPGFNADKGMGFPYWSSPAITYSMSMLALSKIERVQQEKQILVRLNLNYASFA
eukprot:TRINITY_DN962_c0_g1_i3.p2 TRINITY_DN962_c0_g1~~TRINITY_DN962_c0_g1_i3.p2  ORF type:complete len:662 (+),score=186.69 TRINITY_DN962_c0_g1_i3:110-2095(+)